jgi:hypothetical protein
MSKFLEINSPIKSKVNLKLTNKHIKVLNPVNFPSSGELKAGAPARIKAKKDRGKTCIYTVWLLAEESYTTVQIQIKQELMSTYFIPSNHGIFKY